VSDAFDVAVVGGGIIGCACAYELATRGASVVLLEREQIAAGASGRNHGLLLTPLDAALLPMAGRSSATYEDVVRDAPLRVHLDPSPIGFLIVAEDDVEREAAREEAETAAACGVPIEAVDGSALRELEPALAPELSSGWLLQDGRRVDPAALTVGLALLARERGADVRTGETVRSVIRGSGRVTGVVTDRGPILASTVVLAAGPWTATLTRPLGVDLPIAGARGWLVHLGANGAGPSRLIGRAGWHLVSERETPAFLTARTWAAEGSRPFVGGLVQPNPDGTVLAGGSRAWAVTEEPEDPEVPRKILSSAVRMFPGLAEARPLAAWWGVRPVTPDDRPIVARVADGLIVASGHGSQGVILGGGTGELVAALARGEPPPFDPAPFAPDRFARTMVE